MYDGMFESFIDTGVRSFGSFPGSASDRCPPRGLVRTLGRSVQHLARQKQVKDVAPSVGLGIGSVVGSFHKSGELSVCHSGRINPKPVDANVAHWAFAVSRKTSSVFRSHLKLCGSDADGSGTFECPALLGLGVPGSFIRSSLGTLRLSTGLS
jgi:hypothetical protein